MVAAKISHALFTEISENRTRIPVVDNKKY
jgi:hypothetical protein